MADRKPKLGLRTSAAAAALACFCPSAAAQQDNSAAVISIEGQDLDAALRALARQTGAQIVFAPALVRGHRATAFREALSTEQALRRLLAHTGLTYRSTGRNTFTILAQAGPVRPHEGEADTGALSEIIVTAQRREERMQDVPIAVAAVSAEALDDAGLSATRDLPQIVPSVQLTRSGPSGLFFIRGVGTTNAAAGEEGAIAMYVDGVYLGDLGQTISQFNSIDHVEVLRGPQGTLFGRNATGGLIHVITRDPGDALVVQGALGVANYETVSSQFYVGGPLTENLSADVAFTASHQNEGWGRNLTLDTDTKLGEFSGERAKLVWRAGDGLRFTFAGDHFESEDNLGISWRIADGTLGFGGNLSPGGHNTTANTPSQTRLDIQGASITGEWDFGPATLTSITAARENLNHTGFDVDGGPLNRLNISYVSKSGTFQQELRLASNGATPLGWQFGLFYLRSKARTDQFQLGLDLASVGDGFHILSDLDTDSYAAFGEANWSITPATTLTLGARYTEDRRELDAQRITILAGGAPGAVAYPPVSRLNSNELTYRLALRQEFSDDVSAYLSYNRGFKAGTFNLQNPVTAPVEPQYIDAYEIGLKSELFNRRLRLNLAAYHYDIEDYQVRSAAVGATGSSILLNAASVDVDGLDLEFEAVISEDLALFGGFTALRSRFDRFGGPTASLQAPFTYPSPATCTAPGTHDPGTITGPTTGGYTTCLGDASGNDTPLAPDLSASFGAAYTLPLGAQRELRFTGLYSYNSGYVFEPDNRQTQAAFSLFNASIEYRFSDHVGIELWGRNLSDEAYAVQKITTATGVTEVLAAPRTYGLNLRVDF